MQDAMKEKGGHTITLKDGGMSAHMKHLSPQNFRARGQTLLYELGRTLPDNIHKQDVELLFSGRLKPR